MSSTASVLQTSTYGVGTDEHLSTTASSGATYYYCQEQNGDVIALTDASGNFFEFYQYDLFGSPFI